VAVAQSSSDDNAIRYVRPVLWMTSCFHIIEQTGQNRRRPVCFVPFARVAAPGAKSAISDCRRLAYIAFSVGRPSVWNVIAYSVCFQVQLRCFLFRCGLPDWLGAIAVRWQVLSCRIRAGWLERSQKSMSWIRTSISTGRHQRSLRERSSSAAYFVLRG